MKIINIFILFNFLFNISVSLSSDSYVDNLTWMSTDLSAKQRLTISNYVKINIEQANIFKVEEDHIITEAGYNVGYDLSSEKTLESIFNSASSKNRNLKIADIGAGGGRLDVLINATIGNNQTLNFYVVDGVEKNLKQAQSTINGFIEQDAYAGDIQVKYIHSLVQNLYEKQEFNEEQFGTFDFIICLNVLHFLPIEQKDKALCHFAKLVKPGGQVIISHFASQNYLKGINADYNINYTPGDIKEGPYFLIRSWRVKPYCIITPKRAVQFEPYDNYLSFKPHSYYKRTSDSESNKLEEISILEIEEKLSLNPSEPFITYEYGEYVSEQSMRKKLENSGLMPLQISTLIFGDYTQTNIQNICNPYTNNKSKQEAILVIAQKP